MRLRFRPFLTAALLALGGVSAPALSQDSGWFIGAGGGLSKFKDGCTVVGGPGISCDDDGTTWRAFGGYQFNSNFGFELGYADLGEATQEPVGGGSTTFEAKVYEMTLVGTVPLGEQFSVYGKWGFFHWDADRTIVGVGAGTASTSGKDITYGFGVKYNFTRSLALRMEWQRYKDIGDVNFTGVSDVDVFGVNLLLKF